MEHCQWSIKENYNAGKEIICNTEVLESKTCDYNDASVLVKCNVTVTAGSTILVVSKILCH